MLRKFADGVATYVRLTLADMRLFLWSSLRITLGCLLVRASSGLRNVLSDDGRHDQGTTAYELPTLIGLKKVAYVREVYLTPTGERAFHYTLQISQDFIHSFNDYFNWHLN